MIILEIACGIILAVLFFRFLGEILILSAWVVGIGLLIGVGIGIYFLYQNYSHEYPLFFILPVVVILFAIINHYIPSGMDEDGVVYVVHLPADTSDVNKQRVISCLLKNDRINGVFSSKDNREIIVNFNANKTSREAIGITINQLLAEK